jgi:hypothetical protein
VVKNHKYYIFSIKRKYTFTLIEELLPYRKKIDIIVFLEEQMAKGVENGKKMRYLWKRTSIRA